MHLPEPETKFALLPRTRGAMPTRHQYSHTERTADAMGEVTYVFWFKCDVTEALRIWGNQFGATVH